MKQQVQVVVVLLAVSGVCLTAAKPQGAITNEVLGPEAGASFGGYQASAGLQGGPHAQANIPGGSGSSAAASSSSSTTSNQPNRKPGQFYDNIFNIPISVLQAVNQLLQGGGRAKTAGAGAGTTSQGSVAGSSASSSASAGTGTTHRQSNFFDDIFNIPISALTSVNQLLNTRGKVQQQQNPSHA